MFQRSLLEIELSTSIFSAISNDFSVILDSLCLKISSISFVKLLKKTIEINPKHDGSLNTLGYMYAEEGENLDEAMDLIIRALVIDPDNGAYLDSLAWVYYKKGEYQKAIEIIKRADQMLQDPLCPVPFHGIPPHLLSLKRFSLFQETVI